ncbi:mitochondrial fission ELM1 family protein [Stella sp.]|uniref:mitochondrial fission ELM1 family protein n=1 Tax=Stella sp. TaxID=2912054 RepID=UPI0035B316C1
MTAPLHCWLLHDGKAGNLSQLSGLAGALGEGLPLQATVGLPWSLLPGALWRRGLGPRPAGDLAAGDLAGRAAWPEVAIGAGRRTGRAVLWVRGRSGGASFAVQIQDCGLDPALFDLVTVPQHDRLRGPNVVVTDGAIHKVTAAALAGAAEFWGPRLAHLPRPRVAVMIGGNSRAYRMTEAAARGIARDLLDLQATERAGLMVTASRRTGPESGALLRQMLGGTGIAFWDGQGDNPYLGYLALADAVVVTADSVSMTSEASATGRPVHVLELPGGSEKFRRFHAHFRALGITRPFAGRLADWSYRPPDDAGRVAAEIRRRLAGRPQR